MDGIPHDPGRGYTSGQEHSGRTDFLAPRIEGTKPKPRGLLIGATLITIVLVVALIFGFASSSGSGNASTTPSRAVLLSAQTALADKTADLRLSVTMNVPNEGVVTASGGGVVDFTNSASKVTVQYSGLPQLSGMQLSELFVGGSFYVSVPGISTIVPGKSWVSESVPGADPITPGSSNPGSMLQLLAGEGGTVNPLGPSTIDGAGVHGYAVVISSKSLSQRLNRLNLPSKVDQSVMAMFGNADVQLTVYVSDATNLVRRVDFTLKLKLNGTTVAANETEDLSNYGVPVSISTPPASQVVTLQQFEAAARAAGSSDASSKTTHGSAEWLV